jgi:hypothetical protein
MSSDEAGAFDSTDLCFWYRSCFKGEQGPSLGKQGPSLGKQGPSLGKQGPLLRI